MQCVGEKWSVKAYFCIFLLLVSSISSAASKEEIDARVDSALARFYEEVEFGRSLAAKSEGILVFPRVVKAGFGVGGEFGEGALLVGGEKVAYYNTASASIGFQLGAQARTQIVLFMTADELERFRYTDSWEVGVDGSVALIELGVGGDINSSSLKEPIIGFVLNNKGLMYNLTLEGSKITKISK